MDPATLLGMGMALGALLVMMLLEGSSPLAVVLLPTLVLVFGGTFGAAIAGSAMSDVRRIGSRFRLALTADRGQRMNPRALQQRLRSLLPPGEAHQPAA